MEMSTLLTPPPEDDFFRPGWNLGVDQFTLLRKINYIFRQVGINIEPNWIREVGNPVDVGSFIIIFSLFYSANDDAMRFLYAIHGSFADLWPAL